MWRTAPTWRANWCQRQCSRSALPSSGVGTGAISASTSDVPRPSLRRSHQQTFHDDDIEPAAELATDLALGADDLESQGGVEADRRLVTADDAGEHGVEPGFLGGVDQRGEERSADPSALVVLVDVD